MYIFIRYYSEKSFNQATVHVNKKCNFMYFVFITKHNDSLALASVLFVCMEINYFKF
jgi:hypothetical protein